MNTHSIELLELLGAGGHGEVFRGRLVGEGGFSKEVAVKMLQDDLKPDELDELLPRLRDEARLLSMLRHPAIVEVDRLTQIDGRWAIVMEYVAGLDLLSLAKQVAVPEAQALRIVAEVADALDQAWRTPGPDGAPLQLVHRDIKLPNILLTDEGRVKLLDFGIARGEFEGREAETRLFNLGTVGYMSPQRLLGETGPADDIYSLGVVLGELLMGAPLRQLKNLNRAQAADEETFNDTVVHTLNDLKRTGRASEDAQRLVAWCLRYAPEERPDASEVSQLADRCARATATESLSRWARATLRGPDTSFSRRPTPPRSPTPLQEASTRAFTESDQLSSHAAPPAGDVETDEALQRPRRPQRPSLLTRLALRPWALTAALTLGLYAPLLWNLPAERQADAGPLPATAPVSVQITGDPAFTADPAWALAVLIDGHALERGDDGLFRHPSLDEGRHNIDLIIGAGCVEALDVWCGFVQETFEVTGAGPIHVSLEAPTPPMRQLRIEPPALAETDARLLLRGQARGALADLDELAVSPGLYDVELEVGDCSRRCKAWSKELLVPWGEGAVIVTFADALVSDSRSETEAARTPAPTPSVVTAPVKETTPSAGPAAAVLTKDFASWLTAHPEWTAEPAFERGDVGASHLTQWTGATPPELLLRRAVTSVAWSAAEAFCSERGGLADQDSEPLTWTVDAQQPSAELRQAMGRPALRLSSGQTRPVNEQYGDKRTGFRCSDS